MKKHILFISVVIQLNCFAMEKEEDFYRNNEILQLLEKADELYCQRPWKEEPLQAMPEVKKSYDILYTHLKENIRALFPIQLHQQENSYFSLLPSEIIKCLKEFIVQGVPALNYKMEVKGKKNNKIVHIFESKNIPFLFRQCDYNYRGGKIVAPTIIKEYNQLHNVISLIISKKEPLDNESIITIGHLWYSFQTEKLSHMVSVKSYNKPHTKKQNVDKLMVRILAIKKFPTIEPLPRYYFCSSSRCSIITYFHRRLKNKDEDSNFFFNV